MISDVLTFKGGISYTNKTSLGDKILRARYVGSSATFPVAVYPKQKIRLAALSFSGSFTAKNLALPAFWVGYEGVLKKKCEF